MIAILRSTGIYRHTDTQLTSSVATHDFNYTRMLEQGTDNRDMLFGVVGIDIYKRRQRSVGIIVILSTDHSKEQKLLSSSLPVFLLLLLFLLCSNLQF